MAMLNYLQQMFFSVVSAPITAVGCIFPGAITFFSSMKRFATDDANLIGQFLF
jgi:hypothetical protein